MNKISIPIYVVGSVYIRYILLTMFIEFYFSVVVNPMRYESLILSIGNVFDIFYICLNIIIMKRLYNF